MKAAAFAYARATALSHAAALLREADGMGKVVAGSQSLGPMLNLRLAQPSLLVDVARVPEMLAARDDGDAVVLGAGITHARIEDGAVEDPTRGLLRRVAAGIAYRAVRNRGTLGGSLAHADPAADWVNTMRLLDPELLLEGGDAPRRVRTRDFFLGPFETVLAEGELIAGLRITKLSAQARWGYWKFCRKPGEFADALGAVLIDPAQGIERAVLGAHGGVPTLLEGAGLHTELARPGAAAAMVADAGIGEDPIHRRLLAVALDRALAQANGDAGSRDGNGLR